MPEIASPNSNTTRDGTVDVRDPIQIAYDQLAQRAEAILV
jgi:hypothetical protein